jgi:hypothetical protein
MEVNPSFPAKTVPEFIAYAKANPHNIMMASAAVRGRAHDRLGGDIAAGALAVVNNERLAEPFRQPLADQPCNDVDVVASGESDDDAHRPRRIACRSRSPRHVAGSAAAPVARCRTCLRWGSFILNLPLASHHSMTSSASCCRCRRLGRPERLLTEHCQKVGTLKRRP